MAQTNKIALITGGSRGLGKSAALKLAHEGHHVVITYHSKKDEAQQVVADIEALGVKAAALQLDVSKVSSFDTFNNDLLFVLREKFATEHINFLVNNAGIDARSAFADTTEEDFDYLLNVHFKGVYFLTQKLLNVIADGGRIINFSTGLSRFVVPGFAAYGSMKAAIDHLTKYMAKELGARGITANTVAPGPIETDFTKGAFDEHPGMKDFLASQTSLGRIGQPNDIGGVVALLCSEGAGWITAQRIEVSGGIFL